ncbi:hypothetical protein AGMMS49546_19210 [Spirochaetia bacterium]|nr:hypothetical protein AGMMS49546_19210 [Spirochaetia bacterium]
MGIYLFRMRPVTIVEMLPKLAERMLFGNRCVLMAHLDGYGVKKHLESTVSEILDDGVLVKAGNGEFKVEGDTVIVSVGDRPDRSLAGALEGKVDKVFCIGDSNIPDSFAESVAAGYYTAAELIG